MITYRIETTIGGRSVLHRPITARGVSDAVETAVKRRFRDIDTNSIWLRFHAATGRGTIKLGEEGYLGRFWVKSGKAA